MSKGPVGDIDKGFNGKCYLNLNLTSKDWCTYKGVCRIDQLALHNGTCNSCKYKKLLDVPKILERLHDERNGSGVQIES